LLEEAELALKNDDSQWALELSSHVHRLESDNLRANQLRLRALRAKASEQYNTGARNYFMTAALSDQGLLNMQVWLAGIGSGS